MSKIRATQKIQLEDVPKDAKDWFGKVAGVVNQFMTETISAINGGLEFEVNIKGKEYVFDFTFNNGVNPFPIEFQWTGTRRPTALYVAQALEDGVGIAMQIAWNYSAAGRVQLTDAVKFTTDYDANPATAQVSALSNQSRYQIRVRIS